MLTKEQLMKLGLTEEQATQVLAQHREAINGNFIPKHRFDEVNGELKTSKEQVADRDKQIKDLQKFAGDSEGLKNKIKELETENETKSKEYKEALTLERKKNAVKLELISSEAKPHDADMVLGLLDLSKIEVDEQGKIVSGFKEQSETLVKEKAFLFTVTEKQEDKGSDTTPPPANNTNKFWNPLGNPPADGKKANDTNTNKTADLGKSLANLKLGMMGKAPMGAESNNAQ